MTTKASRPIRTNVHPSQPQVSFRDDFEITHWDVDDGRFELENGDRVIVTDGMVRGEEGIIVNINEQTGYCLVDLDKGLWIFVDIDDLSLVMY